MPNHSPAPWHVEVPRKGQRQTAPACVPGTGRPGDGRAPGQAGPGTGWPGDRQLETVGRQWRGQDSKDTMGNGVMPRKHLRLLAMVVTAVCAALVGQWLFDPLAAIRNAARLARIRAEVRSAKTLWRAQGISDYEIDFEAGSFVCNVSGKLTVHGGELAAVAVRQAPSDPSSPLVPLDPSRWHIAGCAYEEMTVIGVFERVEQMLEEISLADESLNVVFDKELGFVTEYDYIAGYRRGLLNPVVFDARVWFSFRNLRPIIDS